jgi:16S rRNA (uracil1498-N3)-methyltransferase
MAIHDEASQRLFLDADLHPGQAVAASAAQANYLLRVLRLHEGDTVLVFNGRDGEWRAAISDAGKRGCDLVPVEQTRPQSLGPDVHYLFAPLKRSRPTTWCRGGRAWRRLLRRCSPPDDSRPSTRAHAGNSIEAAEQCGIASAGDRRAAPWRDRRLGSNRCLISATRRGNRGPVADADAVAWAAVALLLRPGGSRPERSCWRAASSSRSRSAPG